MVVGIGVDVVEVARVERALARSGARFLERVFTPAELERCMARRDRAKCLAARFAAKEAVMKALGCGWGPVGWRDIEVAHGPSGEPVVRLQGAARRLAKEKGVTAIHLSLAHDGAVAVAHALAESR
ncbi:MAG: holo-ACP synthase [Bacillota bacterium]|nr:ACP synthase [Bacillota bacterium]REJ36974.1 MAG: ACP synthase [Bacillota bacterium]